MTAQNIYPLSLNGDTFNALKSDYDAMLRQTLTKMEDQIGRASCRERVSS